MGKVVREKLMAVPVDSLWRVITDFEQYPQFVDQVVSTQLLPKQPGKGQLVRFELEIVKPFQYTLEFKLDQQREASWKLVESNFFKRNEGRWVLESKGNQTHALYEVDVDFPFLVPGWITKKLTEVQLPRMLEAFETRALKVKA